MIPFDPTDSFEVAVLAINNRFRPGSMVSGQARNVALWAWAMAAGKQRALRELACAISQYGSRAALCRALQFRTTTIHEFEEFVRGLPDTRLGPESSAEFRAAFDRLEPLAQQDIAVVFVELLQEPELLAAIGRDPSKAKLLQTALRAADLRRALTRLSDMLDSEVVQEKAYQEWCDDHSWVFGGAHQLRDDVRKISDDSIVDLMHPDVSGFRDVVELKRPDAPVLKYDKSHATYYLSRDTSMALGQVHKYLDRLHDLTADDSAGLSGIVAYHPRATIVIGRSRGWTEHEARTLRGLNQRLHGIEVLTYDHLLARAKLLVKNLE